MPSQNLPRYNDPQFMVASSSSSSALFSDLDFLSAPSINPVMIHDRSQAVVTAAEIRRVEVIDHLIVVAGHSVMRIDGIKRRRYSEESWYCHIRRVKTFQDHYFACQKGSGCSQRGFDFLLNIHWWANKKDVGPTSEASYYYLADQEFGSMILKVECILRNMPGTVMKTYYSLYADFGGSRKLSVE